MQSLHERHRERMLFRRYAERRDALTRDELVARYLPLARSLARRYSPSPPTDDDLVQVASLGLLKAIDRFDPDLGTAFSSFAVPTIIGEIRRQLRDHGWMVRPPRDIQERALKVRKVADEMGSRLGRSPTASELAAHLGCSMESVVEALEGLNARRAESLEGPRALSDDATVTLGDTIGAEDVDFKHAEDAMTVEYLLRDLPDREREILRLRYEEDLTQHEIGRRVGLSQMQVSRILRSVMGDLRATALV
jgi:RNA polymerase sigma-B factor